MSDLQTNATEEMKNFVEDKAESVDLPPDTVDDSWLDELEPYAPPQQPVQAPQQPVQTAQPSSAASLPADNSEEAQKRRLEELINGVEHIDTDVATEVYNRLVKPTEDRLTAEVNELRRARQEEERQRRDSLVRAANAGIRAKYPKADKILGSRQFVDFVNETTSPYATEQNFDILSRAYYAGDAEYVIGWLDKFVESRGKPKPSVGVEVPQAGGGSPAPSAPKRGMTDEEYLAKRRAIRSAPVGTYPPGALEQLAKEYSKGRT